MEGRNFTTKEYFQRTKQPPYLLSQISTTTASSSSSSLKEPKSSIYSNKRRNNDKKKDEEKQLFLTSEQKRLSHQTLSKLALDDTVVLVEMIDKEKKLSKSLDHSYEADKAAGSLNNLPISPTKQIDNNSNNKNALSLSTTPTKSEVKLEPTWRLKERVKTVGVSLILALNIGTDPPDRQQTCSPSSKLQCWIDPTSMSRSKARDKIGELLEAQYSKWQQRAKLRYKRALDPTVDEVRSLCIGMRRFAKSERILLHYNGHGVPRPTANGEIWVFDKDHTQYIPLSVSDLKSWMGKPSILVLDCSGAGVLLPFLENHPETDTNTTTTQHAAADSSCNNTQASSSMLFDIIVLAPCQVNEWLPQNPSDFPADIFTSCLTTPIPMALRWFVYKNPLSMMTSSFSKISNLDKIPGQLNDRKTPLGELNWIFAAVTDTIAWNILPSSLFQRLFRQDLLVAGLFRNFLLAIRILRSLNCTPVSYPPLPSGTEHHPLWQAFDLAVETCLFRLHKEGYLNTNTNPTPQQPSSSNDYALRSSSAKQLFQKSNTMFSPSIATTTSAKSLHKSLSTPIISTSASAPVISNNNITSPFFAEQLTAFEIWLEFALSRPSSSELYSSSSPPEQLPVVLQVLLSQAHRVRALSLLNRFLDLGPFCINLALSVGIFPYVLKLLNSHVDEYKHVLIGIWAKILSFDPSCQFDLVKDCALSHFIQHLNWGLSSSPSKSTLLDNDNANIQRIMAAFILSMVCLDYTMGQNECLRLNLHLLCANLLSFEHDGHHNERTGDPQPSIRITPEFRMWLCICLGNLCQDNLSTQSEIFTSSVHSRLFIRLIEDNDSNVRAAAAFALGCLIGSVKDNSNYVPSWMMKSGMNDTLSSSFHNMNRLSSTGFNKKSSSFDPLKNIMFASLKSSTLPNSPTSEQSPNADFMLDNNNRLPYDLLVGKRLLEAIDDASPTVRYEAITSIACLVDKYLDIFAAVAVEGAFSTQKQQQQQKQSSVATQQKSENEQEQPQHQQDMILTIPSSIDSEQVDDFFKIWSSLRRVQRQDPHPGVSSVANAIASFVHEHILIVETKYRDMKVQSDNCSQKDVDSTEGSTCHRSQSMNKMNFLQRDESSSSCAMSHSSTIAEFPSMNPVHNTRRNVIPNSRYNRRQSDSYALKSSMGGFVTFEGNSDKDNNSKYSREFSLPKSKFFDWKRQEFTALFKFRTYDKEISCYSDEDDPLSAVGAMKAYRRLQIEYIHDHSFALAKNFRILVPNSASSSSSSPFMDRSIYDDDSYFIDDEAKVLAAEALEAKVTAKKKEARLTQSGLLKNDGHEMTSLLQFHAYQPALIVCDRSDSISIWDIRNSVKVNSFCNQNQKTSRITSVQWLNEQSNSLLIAASDDGTLRVWDGLLKENGHLSEHKPTLLTSFNAAPELNAGQRGSGLVLEWQQFSGRLIAGGNSNSIRCWDLSAEKCYRCFDRKSNACVTTLVTAWDSLVLGENASNVMNKAFSEGSSGIGPNIVVAGYGDGSLKVFDIRSNSAGISLSYDDGDGSEGMASSDSKGKRRSRRPKLLSYTEHSSWVVDAFFTSYGTGFEIMSGCVGGDVKFFDLRYSSSVRTVDVQRSPMTALAMHSRVPLIATGSHAQFIKILTLDGDTLDVIRYHDEFNRRIGPVSCLTFHPHKLLLAAGATDEIVSLYEPLNLIQ